MKLTEAQKRRLLHRTKAALATTYHDVSGAITPRGFCLWLDGAIQRGDFPDILYLSGDKGPRVEVRLHSTYLPVRIHHWDAGYVPTVDEIVDAATVCLVRAHRDGAARALLLRRNSIYSKDLHEA